MTILSSQEVSYGLSELIKLGPAFAIILYFLNHVIKRSEALEVRLSESEKAKTEMLKDTISGLNKASFALENSSVIIKESVKSSIRDEVSLIRRDIEAFNNRDK